MSATASDNNASELRLGATACEGRGRGGRAVTQTPQRLVAGQSNPKQNK